MPRVKHQPYWRSQPNLKRRGERQLERAAQRAIILEIERKIGVHPKYRTGAAKREQDPKDWEALYKTLLVELTNNFANSQRKE